MTALPTPEMRLYLSLTISTNNTYLALVSHHRLLGLIRLELKRVSSEAQLGDNTPACIDTLLWPWNPENSHKGGRRSEE